MKRIALLILPALLVSGCAAKVVTGVIKAPFKVAGEVVDAVTTSQKEADLKRGRALRKQEERDAKARKKAKKAARKNAKRYEDG